MFLSQKTVDERLVAYRTAIEAALSNADIAAKLPQFGFDKVEITRGKGLYETAYQLHQTQQREYGEQFGATDAFNQAREAAFKHYMEMVTLARFALGKDRQWLNQLDLAGDRERVYEKSLVQMEQFYDTALLPANTELRTRLARRGLTEAALQTGKALVDDMIQKRLAQNKETGEAQRATRDRDNAMDALDEWAGEFIEVAKFALRSEPELIEAMGLVDPSV